MSVSVDTGGFYNTGIPEGWVYYKVHVGDYATQEQARDAVMALENVLAERDPDWDYHVPDAEDYIEVGSAPKKKTASWVAPVAALAAVGAVVGILAIASR